MPTPDYVGLPDDAPSSTNKIRSYSVVDEAGNTVLEQVSVIADDLGNVVGVRNGVLLVNSDALEAKLDDLIVVMKRINDLLFAGLHPKRGRDVYLEDGG